MLQLDYPRDLVMIGAIFGFAAFIWAGWAQEGPPAGWGWRVGLVILQVLGLVLVGLSVPTAIRGWHTGTAIDPATTGFKVYIIVFWGEFLIAGALAFFAYRSGRSDLVAPMILGVVGLHFIALALVFHQPVLFLAAALLTALAVVVVLLPSGDVARSFWCGVIGAPVFLVIGAWCTIAATPALSQH